MSPPHRPFNALPPLVIALAVAVLGIEIVLWLAGRELIGGPYAAGWRQFAIERFAFWPELWERDLANGTLSLDTLKRLVTYPFVHSGFIHAAFVAVFILALGKLTSEVLGAAAFLVVFFGSAIGGALIYTYALSNPYPVFGGYPAVYGLIGGYTVILWVVLGKRGEVQIRAFSLIGILLAVQLVFALLFGGQPDWIADVGGFVTGFVLTLAVSPGAGRAMLARIRRD